MFYAAFWGYMETRQAWKAEWEVGKSKILKQPAQISFKFCFHHLLAVLPKCYLTSPCPGAAIPKTGKIIISILKGLL